MVWCRRRRSRAGRLVEPLVLERDGRAVVRCGAMERDELLAIMAATIFSGIQPPAIYHNDMNALHATLTERAMAVAYDRAVDLLDIVDFHLVKSS